MIQPIAWLAVMLSQGGISLAGPRPLAVLRLSVIES
jgi:hypothetical protein